MEFKGGCGCTVNREVFALFEQTCAHLVEQSDRQTAKLTDKVPQHSASVLHGLAYQMGWEKYQPFTKWRSVIHQN